MVVKSKERMIDIVSTICVIVRWCAWCAPRNWFSRTIQIYVVINLSQSIADAPIFKALIGCGIVVWTQQMRPFHTSCSNEAMRTRLQSSASWPQQVTMPSPSGHGTFAASDQEDDKEETMPQGRNASTHHKNPIHTNKAGLPKHIQKQLLQDIKNSGGIGDTSSLKCICDSKPDIYGDPSSEKWKQVRSKVRHWKTLSSTEYYQLVATLGVRLPATLQRTPEQLTPTLTQSSSESFATSPNSLSPQSLSFESPSLSMHPPSTAKTPHAHPESLSSSAPSSTETPPSYLITTMEQGSVNLDDGTFGGCLAHLPLIHLLCLFQSISPLTLTSIIRNETFYSWWCLLLMLKMSKATFTMAMKFWRPVTSVTLQSMPTRQISSTSMRC